MREISVIGALEIQCFFLFLLLSVLLVSLINRYKERRDISGGSSEKLDDPPQISESLVLEKWLDELNIVRPKKRIYRDFADGYLFAIIVKKHYPNLIDVHNYTQTFKHAAKLNNWRLLKSKVLKKLNIHVTEKMMDEIAGCVPGAVDNILLELKNKIQKDFEPPKDEDAVSSDGSWYDVEVIDENSDIMLVPVRRKLPDDKYEIFKKKVISYEIYEATLGELSEKNEAIEILKKKVQHFEDLLKSKDNHIEELQKTMSRKALRTKKNEMSLLDTKPENLEAILELNYTARSDDGTSKSSRNSTNSNDLINFESVL